MVASDEDVGKNAELLYSVTDSVRYSVDVRGAVRLKVKTLLISS